jgi:hypothetical protein
MPEALLERRLLIADRLDHLADAPELGRDAGAVTMARPFRTIVVPVRSSSRDRRGSASSATGASASFWIAELSPVSDLAGEIDRLHEARVGGDRVTCLDSADRRGPRPPRR